MLSNILDLIRIKDWLKNIILFFPLIFSGQLLYIKNHQNIFIIFFIFCLSASIIYIINDILDFESDRLHPIKKNSKPIASKRISLSLAKKLLFCVSLILIILLFFNQEIFLHVLVYMVINLIYNFYLKKIAVVDIISLAFGYVVRLDAGSHTIEVVSSNILIVTIFSLALYVLSIKRLKELQFNSLGRSSLKFYSKYLLNAIVIVSAINFLLFYFSYIIYKNSSLIISFPFIIYILFRYYKLAIKGKRGEFPIDLVIKDKILFFLSLLTLIIIIFNFI